MKSGIIMVMSFASTLCLIWAGVSPVRASSPNVNQLTTADSGSIVLAQEKGISDKGDKKGKMMTPGAAPSMQSGAAMTDIGGEKKGGEKKGGAMAPGVQPGSMMMDKGDKGGDKGGGKEGGGKKGSLMAPGMQPGAAMTDKGDKGGDKKGKMMTPGAGMQQQMGPAGAGQVPQAPQQMGR